MRIQELIINERNNPTDTDGGGTGRMVVPLQDHDLSRRQFGLGAVAAGLAGIGTEAGAAQHRIDQIVRLHPRAKNLYDWARRYISDVKELASFMSQCAHESDNFTTVEEYGTPEMFLRKYDVQYNPRLARDLGNTQPGDGARFHGRGYIQLTGRWNYDAAGRWLTQLVGRPIDLTAHPEWIAQPTGAALASLWYWRTFSRPRIRNFNNTPEVTRTINPALAGEQNRERKHAEWRRDLGVPQPRTKPPPPPKPNHHHPPQPAQSTPPPPPPPHQQGRPR